MTDIKTGNKGFINPADDDKVYVMDPVPPGDPGANANPPDYDPGNMTVDNSVRDISAKTRITLGTYLSKVTKGEIGASTKPNAYPIDPSTNASLPSPITTQGFPTPLNPSSNSAQFKGVLPSSFSPDFPAVKDEFKKGKSPAVVPDGNILLPTATPDAQSTQLTPGGPVQKYTAAVVDGNRWELDGPTFSGGEDISQPSKSFNVPLQSVAVAGMPSTEVSSQAQFSLDLEASLKVPAAATAGNSIPVPGPFDASNLSALTTNEVPSPLTPTTAGFSPNLPSSFSDDYAAADLNGTQGLQKGKTSIEGPDGNEFIAKVELQGGYVSSPAKLVEYTETAIVPNRWEIGKSGFSDGNDILSPPAGFDAPGQSFAPLVMPNEESLDSSQYELDLKSKVKKSSAITSDNAYPASPGTPDGSPNITAITSPDGKYPAPLTPPLNQNPDVHSPFLSPSTSEFFPPVAEDLKKGKRQSADSAIDGNSLLGDSIQTNSQGVTILNPPVEEYTESVLGSNELNPKNTALDDTVNINNPPADYYRPLVDINEKGSYAEAKKETIYLNETPDFSPTTVSLRKIPGRLTEKSNDFPVDTAIRALSAVTDVQTGDPTPLSQVSEINSNFYTKNKTNAEIALLKTDAVPDLSRGKGQSPYNGNNLLLTVDGDVSVAKSVDKHRTHDEKLKNIPGIGELSATSRGTPVQSKTPTDHPVVAYEGQRGSSVLGVGSNRFAAAFTSNAIASTFNPTYTLADGTRVPSSKLAQVGIGLSQRASAEIPAWTADKFDPTSAIADFAAVLPSVNQLGILKVSDLLLSAKDTFDSIEGEFSPENWSEIAPFGGQSWGNLTNTSEPYDDAFSYGLFITTLLMIIAIKILFIIISAISGDEERVKGDVTGKMKPGEYKFKKPEGIFGLSLLPSWYELFGVNPTQNSFGRCLDVGTNAYFVGAENGEAGLGDYLLASIGVGNLFKDDRRMYTALITCRTIVRSAFLLAVALDKIARSPNAIAGIRGFLNIMRVVRASKFITAINVFSTLGDRILTSGDSRAFIVGPDGKNEDVFLSSAGHADSTNHASVRKSRIGSATNYDPTLAWSSQRSPSLYLINSRISDIQQSDVDNALGSFKGAQALDYTTSPGTESSRAKVYGLEGPRISEDSLRKMENALEAEYVPFYFHDVRTNEVISFHAFLASLSDDFTASYDSVEGFGRIEPVKIYKGTQRKIGISFHVASTSAADFDHMWHKLNKLTTMVYPQYTRGKSMVGQNYNFVAPFSQLVGASPLIRIRLGDLIRGNYSRFALARLFGMVDGDASVIDKNGKQQQIKFDDTPKTRAEKQKKFEERRRNFQTGDKVIFNPILGGSSLVQKEVTDSILFVTQARASFFNGGDSGAALPADYGGGVIAEADTQGTGIRIEDEDLIAKERKSDQANIKFQTRDYEVVSVENDYVTLKTEIDGNEVRIVNVDTDVYVRVPKVELRMHNETEIKIRKEIFDVQTSLELIDNFISPSNNSITKSFESAGGKGLAGFIESMQFDWYGGTTWEIQPGSTAPKMCKVTISFSPIHDITPGIDHTGYNRAPVYPVGDAMRSAAVKPTPKQ